MAVDADLLNDLDDFSGGDSDDEQTATEELNAHEQTKDYDADDNVMEDASTADLLKRAKLDEIQDITKVSTLPLRLKPLLQEIDHYSGKMISKKDEYEFLTKVNSKSIEIQAEIELIHGFLKIHYRKRYHELERIVRSPIHYAQVVKVLGNKPETADFEKLDMLTREQCMTLSISVSQNTGYSELTSEELERIFSASDLLLYLHECKIKIDNYVSTRLAVFAPNLTAIVGSQTAAQLITYQGGLEQLTRTPSCNVSSFGNKRQVEIGLGRTGEVHTGFLYDSPLIQDVSPDLKKQAMRIVSGKLILAARVDLSSNSQNDTLGKKWRKEILEKIEKLEEPPELQKEKALKVPDEVKAKKRGGKRYRKIKQQHELSELRKAQDRVVFGQQEKTVMDASGEEIGLGMTGSMSHIPLNSNNRAKMSKSMKNRLAKSQNTASSQDFTLPPPPSYSDRTKQIEGPQIKKLKR